MHNYGKTIQPGVALVAGILFSAVALRPQMPAVGPVWEYASVVGLSSAQARATICYSTPGGCRNDVADSMMMAASKLGEKGWELASVTDGSGGGSGRVMYFKRLRSVLNRSDSQ